MKTKNLLILAGLGAIGYYIYKNNKSMTMLGKSNHKKDLTVLKELLRMIEFY